jgi:hypothetical protein
MKRSISNALLASSEASYDIASILPQTDMVLELQDMLLHHFSLLNAIIEGQTDFDDEFLSDYYDKSNHLIEEVAKYREKNFKEIMEDGQKL